MSRQGPAPEGGEPPCSSARSSYLTLLNAAVGAGVLSFPSAFRETGWAGGLILLLVVGLVEAFTLYVLSRYAESTGARTYTALVREMLGPGTALALSVVMLAYLWGSGVAYLIIIGDSFQPLAAQLLGPGTWAASRAAVVSGIGGAVILPLCFPATLGALAAVSSITLYGLGVVVTAVGLRSLQILAAAEQPWASVRAFNLSVDSLAALPVVVFGFQCHTQVIAVFEELEAQPAALFGAGSAAGSLDQLPASAEQQQAAAEASSSGAEASSGDEARGPPHLRGRRPKSVKLLGMLRVVLAAVATSGAGYALTGLAGYLAFPETVASNVLNSFPPDDVVMQVARVAVGLIQIASYPVNHAPARATIADLVHALTGARVGGSTAFRIAEPLLFFASTLGLSLLVRDLGSVFRLIGGTGGAMLILGLPGALLVQYSWAKHAASRSGLSTPLLGGEEGAEGRPAPAAAAPGFHVLASKLWWAGVVLIALAGALCSLTIYSVFLSGR